MGSKMTGLKFDNRELVVGGQLCRIAHLDAEECKFLNDPQPVLVALHSSKMRIDLFTFREKPLDTSPRSTGAMERDNLVVLSVPTLNN